MLSTMYFLSGEEKLVNLMPAALVTSVNVTAGGPARPVTGEQDPMARPRRENNSSLTNAVLGMTRVVSWRRLPWVRRLPACSNSSHLSFMKPPTCVRGLLGTHGTQILRDHS